MGGQESKPERPSFNDDIVRETSSNGSVLSSPILTSLDPRSPSANIARTPLEQVLQDKTVQNAIGCVEEDITESENLARVTLGIDPRSPTLEFVRTPITVQTTIKEKGGALKNKNLEKVRQSAIQTTPLSAKTSTQIPPKLLSSSPVFANTDLKRKSFVGLLETNVDFTETNLDVVQQARAGLNTSLPVDVDVQDDIVPLNKLKNQMETLKIDGDVCNVNKEDEKLINVTAHVKDFDKKLTNLIYEDESDWDEDKKISLKKVKPKENVRTPLASRDANESHKKGTQRLKVSDKPRKSEISKIPVFKDGHKKVQCENTPPTQMNRTKIKTKMSHWDADKTLII